MLLPLSDAAKLAGVSKSALFKAVKRGTVSGIRDDVSDEWRIEISELERVYPLKSTAPLTADTSEAHHSPARKVTTDWSADRQHFEARISALESERDYLRQALQTESEERRQITRLLTQPQPSADLSAPRQRTPWILYVIGLSTVTAAGVAVWHLVRSGGF
jgi:hypothetical protein